VLAAAAGELSPAPSLDGLDELVSAGPVLVTVDNVQWADLATTQALRSMPRRLASSPLSWILAVGTSSAAGPAELLFGLLESDGAARISLGPLDLQAQVALIGDVLGAVPDQTLIELAADAAGNPLVLAEAFRGLRDEDAIVVRDGQASLARGLGIEVMAVGTDAYGVPPWPAGEDQALLDALTIRDRKGKLEGWNVTILGDILHSRVARSNIFLLSKFGVNITLCGPSMWVPRELESLAPNVRRVSRIDDALQNADAIIVLRVQTERLHEPAIATEEYILGYQLTPARLKLARPDALVLHPGPMIRGLEIDDAVADGPQSCVLEQVTNGLAIRMALLYHLVGGAAVEAPPAKEKPKDSTKD